MLISQRLKRDKMDKERFVCAASNVKRFASKQASSLY